MKTLLAVLLSLLAVTAQAAAPAPDAIVKNATEDLRKQISANHDQYKANLPAFYKVVDDKVVPHFDVPYIGKLVLARNWKTASDDQRTRFQTAFKDMLIKAYANALLDNYDAVDVAWAPLRMTADTTDVTVNSTLNRKAGPPIHISFLMHEADGDWKIYDVLIENVSLVSNFRAQFTSEIKKTSLDDVIKRMESGELAAQPQQGGAK
ncbi:MAG TPA: ABC transporter substrate-binding protein [Nevskiaceae bacterium]|nr:ABC transporter substrate-binding protein [Nevskiaceae bacterium]